MQIQRSSITHQAAAITPVALLLISFVTVGGCRGQSASGHAPLATVKATSADDPSGSALPGVPPVTPVSESADAPQATTEHFSHITFAPPAGWKRAESGGWAIFSPSDLSPGQTVAIEVSPGGASSRPLADEFAALLATSANGMTTVQQNPAKTGTDRQGLSTISQTLVLQDAGGAKHVRVYVARRNGPRFEAMMFTASSPELASKYFPPFKNLVATAVFDGAPSPKPVAQVPYPGANTQPHQSDSPATPPIRNIQNPGTAANPAQQPALRPVRLPPMAARPMWITGRAVLENGQPIPKFRAQAGGFSGKFDPLFNNHLGGPQARETGTAFGMADGANGQYAIHMTQDAAMTSVYVLAEFHFDDTNWGLLAWPTDNISDGTSPATNDEYRGQVSMGIVRDFVLKMSGIKPGYDPAKCPDHEGNVQSPRSAFAYYGGTIQFSCGDDSTAEAHGGLTKVYPAGSIVTVTLTSSGTRVDGLPARTVTRSCPLDVTFTLYGIPYALYSATATLAEPGGAVHNLKILSTMPPPHQFHALTGDSTTPSVVPLWTTSAPVRWKPLQDGTNSVIIPVTMYLGEP